MFRKPLFLHHGNLRVLQVSPAATQEHRGVRVIVYCQIRTLSREVCYHYHQTLKMIQKPSLFDPQKRHLKTTKPRECLMGCLRHPEKVGIVKINSPRCQQDKAGIEKVLPKRP